MICELFFFWFIFECCWNVRLLCIITVWVWSRINVKSYQIFVRDDVWGFVPGEQRHQWEVQRQVINGNQAMGVTSNKTKLWLFISSNIYLQGTRTVYTCTLNQVYTDAGPGWWHEATAKCCHGETSIVRKEPWTFNSQSEHILDRNIWGRVVLTLRTLACRAELAWVLTQTAQCTNKQTSYVNKQ